MAEKNTSLFKYAVFITITVAAIITAFVIFNSKSEDKKSYIIDAQPTIEGQPTIGQADAPVSVVEFGDYKCPACKAWGEQFFPYLIEEYTDNGKVKFSYVNVVFHGEESELGSKAAEAVYKQNPQGYWEFHKLLFSEQPTNDHDSKWITQEKIIETASKVPGIDVKRMQEDMQSEEVTAELQKDSQLVEEYKVELTPTIMINNTIVEDPFDYEYIISLIDKELDGNK